MMRTLIINTRRFQHFRTNNNICQSLLLLIISDHHTEARECPGYGSKQPARAHAIFQVLSSPLSLPLPVAACSHQRSAQALCCTSGCSHKEQILFLPQLLLTVTSRDNQQYGYNTTTLSCCNLYEY
jgi:hypothetical protein